MKAYFVQNWIHLSYICTAPYVLIVLVYVFFVPESARWLHINNRNDEAMIVLRNIAKWNRRQLPDDVYLPIKLLPDTSATATTAMTTVSNDNPNLLPNEQTRRPQRNIFHLFKTKRLCIRTAANSLLWACGSLQVYGLQVKNSAVYRLCFIGWKGKDNDTFCTIGNLIFHLSLEWPKKFWRTSLNVSELLNFIIDFYTFF